MTPAQFAVLAVAVVACVLLARNWWIRGDPKGEANLARRTLANVHAAADKASELLFSGGKHDITADLLRDVAEEMHGYELRLRHQLGYSLDILRKSKSNDWLAQRIDTQLELGRGLAQVVLIHRAAWFWPNAQTLDIGPASFESVAEETFQRFAAYTKQEVPNEPNFLVFLLLEHVVCGRELLEAAAAFFGDSFKPRVPSDTAADVAASELYERRIVAFLDSATRCQVMLRSTSPEFLNKLDAPSKGS